MTSIKVIIESCIKIFDLYSGNESGTDLCNFIMIFDNFISGKSGY